MNAALQLMMRRGYAHYRRLGSGKAPKIFAYITGDEQQLLRDHRLL